MAFATLRKAAVQATPTSQKSGSNAPRFPLLFFAQRPSSNRLVECKATHAWQSEYGRIPICPHPLNLALRGDVAPILIQSELESGLMTAHWGEADLMRAGC